MHAEVKALQKSMGLSYKDAAHRLYMAELERLRAIREAAAAVRNIRERSDRTVFQEIYPPIMAIDRGDFDESVPVMPRRADSGRGVTRP